MKEWEWLYSAFSIHSASSWRKLGEETDNQMIKTNWQTQCFFSRALGYQFLIRILPFLEKISLENQKMLWFDWSLRLAWNINPQLILFFLQFLKVYYFLCCRLTEVSWISRILKLNYRRRHLFIFIFRILTLFLNKMLNSHWACPGSIRSRSSL